MQQGRGEGVPCHSVLPLHQLVQVTTNSDAPPVLSLSYITLTSRGEMPPGAKTDASPAQRDKRAAAPACSSLSMSTFAVRTDPAVASTARTGTTL
eukprot:2130278-Rhodomonas_salina.1